jgi:hypothetical protein
MFFHSEKFCAVIRGLKIDEEIFLIKLIARVNILIFRRMWEFFFGQMTSEEHP